ncbi:putative potassium transport system protein kup [Phycisphaerae bacterium]|nr:putative potassium transport system protein kup [Phycisphaerae bacterium]
MTTPASQDLTDSDSKSAHVKHPAMAALSLAALGIVFGDIGTSPLYAFRAGFLKPEASQISNEVVFGLISVFFWTLIFVIGIKYAFFILRADNRGEGGIFALLSLLPNAKEGSVFKLPTSLFVMGIAGAAMLYADGLITPAMSVLSALEGLKELTPIGTRENTIFSEKVIIALAIVVLIGIFSIQRKGSSYIGRLFGPVMIVWFFTIGLLGFLSVTKTPQVLQALNPFYILEIFQNSFWSAITVLGAAMLCVSGGEALYADLGHFGRKPIILGWYFVVLPGLLLSYLGQGALLMRDPNAIVNPFFILVPEWGLFLMVLLATAAAIIASQSIITGMFSLTNAAILMGLLPRLRVVHTSEHGSQIYVPALNVIAVITVSLIVLSFRTSEHLSHAYGLAVAMNMAIVTMLFGILMFRHKGWGLIRCGIFLGIFLSVDLLFVVTNVFKIPNGGWLTLLIASVIIFLMLTWIRGRKIMIERYSKQTLDYVHLLNNLQTHPILRVPGTAVFLTPQAVGVPPTLLHHIKHNKALHEQVVVMSVQATSIPFVDPEDQVTVTDMGDNFWAVSARHGFLQSADVPRMLRIAGEQGLETNEGTTTYYLGRTIITPRGRSPMPGFQKRIFCALAQISSNNPLYFSIPPGRMVELGIQVDI